MADTLTPDTPLTEHRFPCDTCGSDLRYAPDSGKLVCDHCGNTETIEGAGFRFQPIAELDLRKGLQADLAADQMEETRVTTCPNCAAQVEFEGGKHATECPFCATPVVVDTGTHRHIKPRAVLPFALTEDVARDAMKDWLGRLWFAPNGLQEYARKGRRMQGIYVPYW
ncbi:MAG: TFIIB-type zinc finger domain-containing protein, partial [Sulfitobacter sp.]|nr:TFIIB-type zinc finger domain-containing protein [Sulfitobacter sp.]